jgi:hypothetical protein
MPWKPVTQQIVIARIDGEKRQLLVTDWNRYTGAVRVSWPLGDPTVVSRHRVSGRRGTEIDKAQYEPLDPDAFKAATER